MKYSVERCASFIYHQIGKRKTQDECLFIFIFVMYIIAALNLKSQPGQHRGHSVRHTGWMTRESWFDSLQGNVYIFSSARLNRLQCPGSQWMPSVSPLRKIERVVKLTTCLHLISRLRIYGAENLVPHLYENRKNLHLILLI